jgi:hypothetical protein
MFFPSLLYKSQETVMHWDVSFPFPSSNNPKKIGVFDPTHIHTNKQTNKQTTRLQTLLQRLQRDGIYERGRR